MRVAVESQPGRRAADRLIAARRLASVGAKGRSAMRTRTRSSRWLAVLAVASACGSGDHPADVDADPAAPDAVVHGDGAQLVDDAELVSAAFPPILGCGGATTATVVVRNIGTSTWTTEAGY